MAVAFIQEFPIQNRSTANYDYVKQQLGDGPFAETKEAVGGFDLVECDTLEEAVEIAAAHPVAQSGTIEVRPLWGS